MLIITISFQFSWMVASAYCQHEIGKTSQHFGHHPHQHSTADHNDQKNKSSNKKATSHPDCATCQHGSSMTADILFNLYDVITLQDKNQLSLPPPPMPFLAEPERPKWVRAS